MFTKKLLSDFIALTPTFEIQNHKIMGNLVISNAVLEQANISPAELRLEVAVYLYFEKRLNMNQAQHLSGLDLAVFQKELVKRGIPSDPGAESDPPPAESEDKPHFLVDVIGIMDDESGEELERIVSREFQEIEGQW